MATSNMGSEGLKWFVGTVEDVDDPLKLGRIRVRIFGEHDDMNKIKSEDLNWAIVMMPAVSASMFGIGWSPTGILVGSYVWGFYIDGEDKQFPAVAFTWHMIPEMNDQNHGVSALARESQELVKEQVGPEPESAYQSKYPNNKVIHTASGHAIEIDDTPGAERIHVYHTSGTYVEINSEGRKVTKVVDDDYEIVVNDKIVYVKGDWNVEVKGNINISADGNVRITGERIDLNPV